jgi:hypothetical protein
MVALPVLPLAIIHRRDTEFAEVFLCVIQLRVLRTSVGEVRIPFHCKDHTRQSRKRNIQNLAFLAAWRE